MIVFPNCKINLGLHILRKREDNYHDIETVFYPLDLRDALEIISNENNSNEFTVTGLPIHNNQNNLCIQAYDLLKKDFPQLPFVKMHLHKVIPIGAGLGGGSADAAFTLQLLNEKFQLNLSIQQLKYYALQSGSDCPFFLYNKACYASMRGEVLEPVNLDLSAYKIMLVNPGIFIDTKWAFAKINPAFPKESVKEIILHPPQTWKDNLSNDFEIPVFENYPEIKEIKEALYQHGALYASLSGSGSTVYGIFEKNTFPDLKFPGDYFCKLIN